VAHKYQYAVFNHAFPFSYSTNEMRFAYNIINDIITFHFYEFYNRDYWFSITWSVLINEILSGSTKVSKLLKCISESWLINFCEVQISIT